MTITGQLTPEVQEIFRLVPSRFIYNPNLHDLNKWKLSKYLRADRIANVTFTVDHFDSISYYDIHQCERKGTFHLNAIGHRKGEKMQILIFDEIK